MLEGGKKGAALFSALRSGGFDGSNHGHLDNGQVSLWTNKVTTILLNNSSSILGER